MLLASMVMSIGPVGKKLPLTGVRGWVGKWWEEDVQKIHVERGK